jgi:4-amino-4-deoxy-L-arabinose transferase-like glycosyltransferase
MFIAFSKEHMRFFHSPVESSLSILLIFALIMGWRALKKMPVISVFSLFLILFLAFLALYKTSKYMVGYLPFLLIIIVLIFKERGLVKPEPHHGKVFINGFAVFFIVLYLAVSAWWDVNISIRKFHPGSNLQVTERYFSPGSDTLQIAAPMEFVFNEIGRYESIRGLLKFNQMLKHDSGYYGAGLFRHFGQEGIDAACFDRNNIRTFGLEGLKTDSVVEGYRVIAASPDILVVRRR